jgi:succinate dehydrogenase/fumarate reductase flavoprotein subunit
VRKSEVRVAGRRFPLVSLNTLIIGSGAAGLAAAVWLHRLGQTDVAVATEEWGGGTSNNAGSDKQTYYKLSLAPDVADSPVQMAQDLTRGGSMHGDIALVEAANSLPAFFHLVGLGVPFPHDRYGVYTGYKTDHDPRARATSAGPLTSRLMFERLASEVKARRIPVFDRTPVVGLLTVEEKKGKRVVGAVGLDRRSGKKAGLGFVLFNAVNVVLATGGPAGMYRASAYPESQTGSHGLAFEAGAVGQNLTESQFGLASIKFRWNLSGAYQQALPRYFSTAPDGTGEREFLNDHFPDGSRLATAIFLKGYQWPFDPRKIAHAGSSLIDVLVHRETAVLGRRVFLDYRRNPSAGGKVKEFDLSLLAPEAFSYLERSGALMDSPLARLQKLNPPAIDVFRDHGIDLATEPLEAAVCCQHSNGGLKGNIWWETTVRHLFAVGELMGTHGVYRPGGSALNAGQVGALRAAVFIARRYGGRPLPAAAFVKAAGGQVSTRYEWTKRTLGRGQGSPGLLLKAGAEIRDRMTNCGAIIRELGRVSEELPGAWRLYDRLRKDLRVGSPADLAEAFKTVDLCLTHCLTLEAIREYLDKGGRSRGSALVPDRTGEKPCPELDDGWRFSLAADGDFTSRHIQEISLAEPGTVVKRWIPPKPIPNEPGWFETVWKDFLKDKIIREEDGHDS